MRKVSPEEVSDTSIRCFFSRDVAEMLSERLVSSLESVDDVRVATMHFEQLGSVEACIQTQVTALTDAARLLWPDWYNGIVTFAVEATASEATVADRIATLELSRQLPGIMRSWLTAAIAASRVGRSPVLPQFSTAIQAEQLARALRKKGLLLIVSLADGDYSSLELASFARSLEWLARETSAAIVAVLPLSLACRNELDSISFAATLVDEASAIRGTLTSCGQIESEERKERVCPIVGRPHPGSPGEQLLAKFLSRDAELAPLFHFNERVVTVFGNRPLVDLVWPEGRVAVEIDGYGYHSTPAAFSADRYRDYELTLSGFLVLRLPHDFVVQDVALAAERVREVVHFRIKHPHIEQKVLA